VRTLLAAGPDARPSDVAFFALVLILFGFITIVQAYVYRWCRSRGRETLLPAWLPGGWWALHPTATLRSGWAVTAVGVVLILVAAYQELFR